MTDSRLSHDSLILDIVQPVQDSRFNSSLLASDASVDYAHLARAGSVSHSFVTLHFQVHAWGLPNFLGVHIPVPTSLNLDLWHSLLVEYSDSVVCEFLQFGWPVGFNYDEFSFAPMTTFRNHKGGTDFPSAVADYLFRETALGAACGPFLRNPFSGLSFVSPLNSVPKQGSDQRRWHVG